MHGQVTWQSLWLATAPYAASVGTSRIKVTMFPASPIGRGTCLSADVGDRPEVQRNHSYRPAPAQFMHTRNRKMRQTGNRFACCSNVSMMRSRAVSSGLLSSSLSQPVGLECTTPVLMAVTHARSSCADLAISVIVALKLNGWRRRRNLDQHRTDGIPVLRSERGC